jgi:uncharacterized protein
MSINILDDARKFLVSSLQGKHNDFETRHPWRKDWEFAVLHSLRVEAYTLKILARELHPLSETEISLLRLAAILHDIARLDRRDNHAKMGSEVAKEWFQLHQDYPLTSSDVERVLEMVADHSNKVYPERDYCKAVLKDADTLDEIGVMSIFMTGNWLEPQSPFFFYHLRQRLIDYELPFCDKKLAILNTNGAREILKEKKAFVENFFAQLTDELQSDNEIEQTLLALSRNGGEQRIQADPL